MACPKCGSVTTAKNPPDDCPVCSKATVSPELVIECPYCRVRDTVPAKYLGRTVKCSDCEQSFSVRHLSPPIQLYKLSPPVPADRSQSASAKNLCPWWHRIPLLGWIGIALFIMVWAIAIWKGITEINHKQIVSSETAKLPEEKTLHESYVPPTELPPAPPYEVVYTLPTHRSDNATHYFILLPPVDLSNDAFKADILLIIRHMAKEHGEKIKLSIFDERKALDLYFDLQAHPRYRTEADERVLMEHYLAGYQGELPTLNNTSSLTYFPLAYTTTPVIGPYVEAIDFPPQDATTPLDTP